MEAALNSHGSSTKLLSVSCRDMTVLLVGEKHHITASRNGTMVLLYVVDSHTELSLVVVAQSATGGI